MSVQANLIASYPISLGFDRRSGIRSKHRRERNSSKSTYRPSAVLWGKDLSTSSITFVVDPSGPLDIPFRNGQLDIARKQTVNTKCQRFLSNGSGANHVMLMELGTVLRF